MKIAILGAGFAGLALTWNILNDARFTGAEVTIFDRRGIGGGASSVSAGLLHTYGGARAKKNRRGDEGVTETLKLLNIASNALDLPVFEQTGLIRLAVTPEQKECFRECANVNDDVKWLAAEECQSKVQGLAMEPGIYTRNAWSVMSSQYLKGLAKACEELGACFTIKDIRTLQEIEDDYDLILVALGADILEVEELKNLPIRRLKGQVLEFTWPKEVPLPEVALSSNIYMVMSLDKTSCIVGSTFEREFSSPVPDPTLAKEVILPKLYASFPALKGVDPISCRAGVRATTANYLPLVKQVSEKCWIFTGLGSKGLLYHALYAKELVKSLVIPGLST